MVSFQLQCWLFFTDERELPCTLLVVVSLNHRHHRHYHSCLQVRYTVLNIIHATFTLGVWIKEMTTLGVSADNHNGNINDDNINVDDEDTDGDHDNNNVDDEETDVDDDNINVDDEDTDVDHDNIDVDDEDTDVDDDNIDVDNEDTDVNGDNIDVIHNTLMWMTKTPMWITIH